MDARRDDALVRGLGPWAAAALVVGTIIGTGVFLKAAPMAQLGGAASWVLIAWAIGGVMSMAGALSFAELSAAYPQAGGEYVYIREAWGRFPAFLYGWTRFWIGTPASIAAYAIGAATFLDALVPLDPEARVPVAIALIAAFTALNCLSVRTGGGFQAALTAVKLVLILGLAVGALAFGGDVDLGRITASGGGDSGGGDGGFPGWNALGLMVLAALWAYDGWNNLPMAAGEVRDPGRNLPRAIVLGTIGVLVVYALVNLAYFAALPFEQVATASSDAHPDAPSVAARTAATFLGTSASALLAVAMMVSALSAMTGSMLTGARVPYAMARDGLAPARLAQVSATARAPVIAVLIQGSWAALLATTGRFDQLTNYVVFASWLFYALNAGSVMRLRRTRPDLPRPFRVPGYPVVPLVFLTLATLLVVNSVVAAPRASLTGLGFIALGAPAYLLVRRRAA